MKKAVNILLVEDNLSDVNLTLRAMKECKVNNEIHVVSDGVQALAFLKHEEPYNNSTRPDLILLDLNLPRIDGREVLRQVKTSHDFKDIPVVVLSTSGSIHDRTECARLHADAYLVKPLNFDDFPRLIRQIEGYCESAMKGVA